MIDSMTIIQAITFGCCLLGIVIIVGFEGRIRDTAVALAHKLLVGILIVIMALPFLVITGALDAIANIIKNLF